MTYRSLTAEHPATWQPCSRTWLAYTSASSYVLAALWRKVA